jgi:hypothetical protein
MLRQVLREIDNVRLVQNYQLESFYRPLFPRSRTYRSLVALQVTDGVSAASGYQDDVNVGVIALYANQISLGKDRTPKLTPPPSIGSIPRPI